MNNQSAQNKRLLPEERRKQLIDAGIQAAHQHGYMIMERRHVAEIAGVAAPLISGYFGTLEEFREIIIREAIQRKDLRVIAQGLAMRDERFAKVPKALKDQARAAI